MAQVHYRAPFKKALLQFITEPDPFLAMLQWVMTELMRIEAEAKVGAIKGKHTADRKLIRVTMAPKLRTTVDVTHTILLGI